jgi:CDP-diacylglycerol--glycerol-3-phosphate 3-phosphatidyltransferase
LQQLKLLARSTADPLARGLVRAGISANALTFLGFLFNGLAGVLASAGLHPWAGLLYLLVGCVDFLDGAVARLSGSAGRFGAFFDSLLDRASEAAVLVGIVYWYAARQQPLLAALAVLALVGSFLVSYARARAEGLGYECGVGWLQRPERVVLLGVGLIASGLHEGVLTVVLAVLTLATAATTVQRISHVESLSRVRERP